MRALFLIGCPVRNSQSETRPASLCTKQPIRNEASDAWDSQLETNQNVTFRTTVLPALFYYIFFIWGNLFLLFYGANFGLLYSRIPPPSKAMPNDQFKGNLPYFPEISL